MALDRVSASLFSLKPHIENFLTSVKATNQSLLAYMAGCISLIRSLADAPSGRLVKSFRVVQPKAELTEAQTRHAIGKMLRGATLMKHALEWRNPSVGTGEKSALVRGLQWRLVMAYSGYEQIEDALFGEKCHTNPTRKKVLSSIRLQHRLPGPVLSQREMDRIERRKTAADELCDFLGVRMQVRHRFTSWLLGHSLEDECDTTRSIFIIGQLRNLVAHGALSADRTAKLGLVSCFEAGPVVLDEIIKAFLNSFASKN